MSHRSSERDDERERTLMRRDVVDDDDKHVSSRREHKRRSRSRSRSRSPRRHQSSSSRRESDNRRKEDDGRRGSRRRAQDDGGGGGGGGGDDDGDGHEDEEDEEGNRGSPPDGVHKLTKDDFFLKSNEFRVWLDERKGKKLDNLRSSDARHYFDKFVKRWNKGSLDGKYYRGIASSSMSSTVGTSYSWTFSKASQRELDDASRIRKEIDLDRSGGGRNTTAGARTLGPTMGPSLPGGSRVEALQQSREAGRAALEDAREADRREYKKQRKDARDEDRDNRATGRDRVTEKRKEVAASNRAMRDDREGGGMVEIDEDTLMGGGDSFKAMLAARDRAKTGGRRARQQEERQAEVDDKRRAYRAKEDSTMAALRELAAARFGPAKPPG